MSDKILLHEHKDFGDLIRVVSDQLKIDPYLVEKDYWIMHCLYGLKEAGYDFQLKGGTSLSKGYELIDRFSEDIDIHIKPPESLDVKTGKNHTKEAHCLGRKDYYDYMAAQIKIPGIDRVSRDIRFDTPPNYFSGGIRLLYDAQFPLNGTTKEGVLLELGFDVVTPNKPLDIGSWALDFAWQNKLDIIDNRALSISCYNPGYTLVEKLQAIVTKFRQQQEEGGFSPNFMRHYYDVFCLLKNDEVQEFIGTKEYFQHKQDRFPKRDIEIPLGKGQALLLEDPEVRRIYKEEYERRPGLYYRGQPPFEDILQEIKKNAGRL